MASMQDCWQSKKEAREWVINLGVGDILLHRPPNVPLHDAKTNGEGFLAVEIVRLYHEYKGRSGPFVAIRFLGKDRIHCTLSLKDAHTVRPVGGLQSEHRKGVLNDRNRKRKFDEAFDKDNDSLSGDRKRAKYYDDSEEREEKIRDETASDQLPQNNEAKRELNTVNETRDYRCCLIPISIQGRARPRYYVIVDVESNKWCRMIDYKNDMLRIHISSVMKSVVIDAMSLSEDKLILILQDLTFKQIAHLIVSQRSIIFEANRQFLRGVSSVSMPRNELIDLTKPEVIEIIESSFQEDQNSNESQPLNLHEAVAMKQGFDGLCKGQMSEELYLRYAAVKDEWEELDPLDVNFQDNKKAVLQQMLDIFTECCNEDIRKGQFSKFSHLSSEFHKRLNNPHDKVVYCDLVLKAPEMQPYFKTLRDQNKAVDLTV